VAACQRRLRCSWDRRASVELASATAEKFAHKPDWQDATRSRVVFDLPGESVLAHFDLQSSVSVAKIERPIEKRPGAKEKLTAWVGMDR
jgi:hypothetical protein